MSKLMEMMAVRHEFYERNPALGGTDLHLLEKIAMGETEGGLLSVTNAMHLNTVASPATIWRCLDKLAKHNYILLKNGSKDTRIKYIFLSSKGKTYFKKLEQALA